VDSIRRILGCTLVPSALLVCVTIVLWQAAHAPH
jgi:hypothetical protein